MYFRRGLHGLTRFLVYVYIIFIRAIRVIRAYKIVDVHFDTPTFLFDFLADSGQKGFHCFGILAADDVQQFVQFGADSFHLSRCARVEQNFL